MKVALALLTALVASSPVSARAGPSQRRARLAEPYPDLSALARVPTADAAEHPIPAFEPVRAAGNVPPFLPANDDAHGPPFQPGYGHAYLAHGPGDDGRSAKRWAIQGILARLGLGRDNIDDDNGDDNEANDSSSGDAHGHLGYDSNVHAFSSDHAHGHARGHAHGHYMHYLHHADDIFPSDALHANPHAHAQHAHSHAHAHVNDHGHGYGQARWYGASAASSSAHARAWRAHVRAALASARSRVSGLRAALVASLVDTEARVEQTGREGEGEAETGQSVFAARLHRALLHLAPTEALTLAFVLGAGLGSLVHLAFMLALLAARALRTPATDEERELRREARRAAAAVAVDAMLAGDEPPVYAREKA
ncbi:hypothetical protein Q5752_005353 [Cryptotrichosporon argae]